METQNNGAFKEAAPFCFYPGTGHKALGAKHQGLGTRQRVRGARYLALGTWPRASGTGHQAPS